MDRDEREEVSTMNVKNQSRRALRVFSRVRYYRSFCTCCSIRRCGSDQPGNHDYYRGREKANTAGYQQKRRRSFPEQGAHAGRNCVAEIRCSLAFASMILCSRPWQLIGRPCAPASCRKRRTLMLPWPTTVTAPRWSFRISPTITSKPPGAAHSDRLFRRISPARISQFSDEALA